MRLTGSRGPVAAAITLSTGLSLALGFASILSAADGAAVIHKGWFSDEGCAKSKVDSGKLGPNGRDCVQKCLREGAKMVFVDETAKKMYYVDNPDVAKGQESHYVEVAGSLNAEKQTLHLASVKVLKEYVASCAVPKKGEKEPDSH
jgi:hypothetical protein